MVDTEFALGVCVNWGVCGVVVNVDPKVQYLTAAATLINPRVVATHAAAATPGLSGDGATMTALHAYARPANAAESVGHTITSTPCTVSALLKQVVPHVGVRTMMHKPRPHKNSTAPKTTAPYVASATSPPAVATFDSSIAI